MAREGSTWVPVSGLNGGETAIAHLYARNLSHIAQNSKCSVALLFVDISSAFASLVRHLVFDVCYKLVVQTI